MRYENSRQTNKRETVKQTKKFARDTAVVKQNGEIKLARIPKDKVRTYLKKRRLEQRSNL